MKALLAIVSVILVVVGLACVPLSRYVTPGEVDKAAVRYVKAAGVADQNDYSGWWPNLADVERLDKDVDTAYTLNRQELDQAVQREDTRHGIHKKTTIINRQVAVQRERALFGPTGLIPLIMSMAGCGTLTGLVGLARKRSGDVTKLEMEQTLATATGKTVAELSAKQKQFVQLVKGVGEFMDPRNGTSPDAIAGLKVYMDKAQDNDTQAAVAVAKVV